MATSLTRTSVLSHVSTKQTMSNKQRATSSLCLGSTLLQLKYMTEKYYVVWNGESMKLMAGLRQSFDFGLIVHYFQ